MESRSTYSVLYYRLIVGEVRGTLIVRKVPVDVDVVEQRLLPLESMAELKKRVAY